MSLSYLLPMRSQSKGSDGDLQGLSEAYASMLMAAGLDSSKPKRKRRRVPVSCETCRQRKLKCDRKHPCGSCVALGSAPACKYQSKEEVFQKFAEKNSNGNNVSGSVSSGTLSSSSSIAMTNSTTPNNAGEYSGEPYAVRRNSGEPYKSAPAYIPRRNTVAAPSDPLLIIDQPATGFQLPEQQTYNQLLDHQYQFRPFGQDLFRPASTSVGAIEDPSYHGLSHIYDQQRLNLFYKPVLTVSHEGVVRFRPGYHCPLPPADDFARQFHNRVNFKLNSSLSGMAPVQLDARWQKYADTVDEFILRLRSPQRRANAWLQVLLEFFPQSAKVCEFLVERFLVYVNSLFHAVSPKQLRSDLSELLVLRQSSVDDINRLHSLPKQQFVLFSEYLPLSHDYTVAFKKDQIHKIGLLLMVFYLARKTLPDDWEHTGLRDLLVAETSSQEVAEALAQRFYFGEGLQTLAACAVKLANIHGESTIPFIQMLCYICVSVTVLGGDVLDSRHSISGRQMVANLVQCALAIGLQRDPDVFYASSNIPMKSLRRHLWRQVVFLDTLNAVKNATSPLLSLRFSDVDMSRYEPVFDEDINVQYGQRAEETFTRLALICRKAYDDILLSAGDGAPRLSVESLDHELAKFSVSPSAGQHHEAVSRISRILVGELRLCLEKIFVTASSNEEAVQHVLRSALPVLEQEKACRYNSNSPFDYVVSSVALRAGHIARTTVVMSLAMPGVMASGYRLGGESRSYSSILNEIQLCQEWLASQSHRYQAWSDYNYISAVLYCISELAPGKVQLDVGDQKCLPPLSSKWVYKLLSELF